MGIIDRVVTCEQMHGLSWLIGDLLVICFLLSAVCCFRSTPVVAFALGVHALSRPRTGTVNGED